MPGSHRPVTTLGIRCRVLGAALLIICARTILAVAAFLVVCKTLGWVMDS